MKSGVRHILTVTDPRPRTKPPMDHLHEFFAQWLASYDPDVNAWIWHFIRTNTPYSVCRDAIRGVMLYAHRIIPARRLHQPDRWCCNGGTTV